MKLGKQKSFNMAQNCGFMIARAWRLNRNIVLGGAALIFCTVGSSLLELFVVPAVLESVGRGVRPGELAGMIVLFALAIAVVRAVKSYFQAEFPARGGHIRGTIASDIHLAFARTSYPHTEDPAYIKRHEKAQECTNSSWSAGQQIYETMQAVAANLICFAIYLALLANVGIGVALLSAALTADRLAECDLVIVALYPQAVVEYVSAHRDHFRKGGVVMDCGGVKGVVCTPLADVVKDAGFWFVGGHPMAGIERSGYGHAFPELFQGASLILTPYPGTPRECLDGIWELARRLGFGHLQLSTPEEHDHIIAYTSQLAHVVSCAYVGSPSAPNFEGFSAGSFKDMTRVAKLNEEMWTELFLENQEALVREIDTLVEELAAFAYTIRRGDRERLKDMLRHAREIKEAIDKDR